MLFQASLVHSARKQIGLGNTGDFKMRIAIRENGGGGITLIKLIRPQRALESALALFRGGATVSAAADLRYRSS